MRIGLLGGSFDPAHRAHRAASLKAIRRLRLDQVWWLVSPGNPLKGTPAGALPIRTAAAAAIARHPRIRVTAIEAAIGTRYTIDTIDWLRRHRPDLRFVWLMGADNLASFHRWRAYRRIMAALPVAVLDRPGGERSPLASRTARQFSGSRRNERAAPRLAGMAPPAWIFLGGPRVDLSSTAIRAGRDRTSS